MSSAYPSTDGIPIQHCQRCKEFLPPDQVYCINCGYYNKPVQNTNSTSSFPPRMTTNPLTPPPVNNNNAFSRPGGSYNPHTPYPPNIDNVFLQSTHLNISMHGVNPSFTPPPMQPGSNQNISGQYIHPGNNAGIPFPQTAFPQQPFTPSQNLQQPFTPSQNLQQPFTPSQNLQQPFNPSQNLQQPFNPSQIPQPPFPPASFGPGTPPNFQTQSGQRPPFFQPEPPVPPQRRKSRWKLVIGIMVLLIVLVGGGLAGYYFLWQPSSISSVQPTASVSIPTPTQPPVFADTFQTNAKGWDLQSENGLFSMTIGQGALTLEDDHNKLLPLAVPGTNATPLSNFMLTFDAQLSSGDPANGYGVNIRGTADQNGVLSTCYRIEFYGDGTYAVFKLAANANGTTTITHLVNYTSNTAIHKRGSVNHLSIIAKGSSFTLIANGQILKNVSDRSYSSGSIEFFVSNLTSVAPGAQAKFSQVAIYNN